MIIENKYYDKLIYKSLFIILMTLLFSGCHSNRPLITEKNPGLDYKIYGEIEFRKNDVFILNNEIVIKDIKKFKQFNVVFFDKNNIIESYFMYELKPFQKNYSLIRPLKIIFKNTKNGLIAGAKIGLKALPLNNIRIGNKYLALFFLAIPAATSVVGMTGGLAKGLYKTKLSKFIK